MSQRDNLLVSSDNFMLESKNFGFRFERTAYKVMKLGTKIHPLDARYVMATAGATFTQAKVGDNVPSGW